MVGGRPPRGNVGGVMRAAVATLSFCLPSTWNSQGPHIGIPVWKFLHERKRQMRQEAVSRVLN